MLTGVPAMQANWKCSYYLGRTFSTGAGIDETAGEVTVIH